MQETRDPYSKLDVYDLVEDLILRRQSKRGRHSCPVTPCRTLRIGCREMSDRDAHRRRFVTTIGRAAIVRYEQGPPAQIVSHPKHFITFLPGAVHCTSSYQLDLYSSTELKP